MSVDEGAQSQAVLPTEPPEEERDVGESSTGEGGKVGERERRMRREKEKRRQQGECEGRKEC